MLSIFSNFHFWMIIAFITTLLVLYFKAKNHINTLLNKKIANIIEENNQAANLLTETMTLFNQKKIDLEQINKINMERIAKAKIEADSYHERVINNLNLQVKNSKSSFNNYLKHEAKIKYAEVQSIVINKSLENIDTLFKNHLDDKVQNKLIEDSINNLGSFLAQNPTTFTQSLVEKTTDSISTKNT
ncbi:ATP synthase subunit b [Candidatus Hepatincolaceae symbiont of Richtersius coronifer]